MPGIMADRKLRLATSNGVKEPAWGPALEHYRLQKMREGAISRLFNSQAYRESVRRRKPEGRLSPAVEREIRRYAPHLLERDGQIPRGHDIIRIRRPPFASSVSGKLGCSKLCG